jgi:hypothetical protein
MLLTTPPEPGALFAGPEPIADPGLRQDVVRSRWILLELLAELAHIDPEVLHIHPRTPDLLHDHAVGKHLASVDDEQAQDSRICIAFWVRLAIMALAPPASAAQAAPA